VSSSIAFKAERAVAVHDDDLLVGLGDLRAEAERQADAHHAERPGVQPMPRRERRHRLPAVVQDLLAVDDEDRVALHELRDLVAERQRMDLAACGNRGQAISPFRGRRERVFRANLYSDLDRRVP
jgi:hypothetical protein